MNDKDMCTEIENLVATLREDYNKFVCGNDAAGARARKTCQAIKTKCQDVRVEIQSIKKMKNKGRN